MNRPLVFSVDVPERGVLGLDLKARHLQKDKPQRGAIVKGFRPDKDGNKGYLEVIHLLMHLSMLLVS